MSPCTLRAHIRVEIKQTELVSECANRCKTAIIVYLNKWRKNADTARTSIASVTRVKH
jgi:hypothetical protein